jgi:hypothetical protein
MTRVIAHRGLALTQPPVGADPHRFNRNHDGLG